MPPLWGGGGFFFVPSAINSNADLEKNSIIKENKGRSGAYRWTNLISGVSYIGSSVNLPQILYFYYSLKRMNKGVERSSSRILRSAPPLPGGRWLGGVGWPPFRRTKNM
uniref:GIY-YIG endonuclease n=1 Tax=Morchella brunnea TaxID=1174671 RepID=A0A8K1MID6_9PEZI|nr:hypothetical protein LK370_mgp230 [Morchella brunnea]UBU98357.1 hypothetical protein [Morchella brunnea]